MPYDIVRRAEKFIVQKQDGSKEFGTHDTEAEAKRQLAALYASESKAAEARTLHLLGALGQARTEMIGSREYLVVPVVALMEGVIHAVNAETPEFVPFEMLKKAAESWNGKPVTLGHPKKDGKQCSAQDDGIIASHGMGTIRGMHVDALTKKMLGEALVEKSRAKKLHPDMYADLVDGKSVEVSVGAMVVTDKTAGAFNGKPFKASWTMAEGDHLAFLPGGRGACSLEMGCGAHRAAMRVCAGGMELETMAGPLQDKAQVEVEGSMKVGDKVKINKPGDDAHGKTGAITSSTKGGTVHTVGDHGSFHQSELRAASIIDPETLRALRDIPQSERDKMDSSDFAGPDESFPIKTQADVDAAKHLIGKAKDPAAVKARVIAIAKRKGLTIPDAWKMKAAAAADGADPEEVAELIAYRTMRTTWDACDPQWDQVGDLIDALIAAETDDATETPEDEDAEEQVETAQIESIRTILQGMVGSLNGLINLTYGSSLSDTPRYMAALAGARHSKQDTGAIQAIHDQSMALGATCDRGNFKMLEDKLDKANLRVDVTKMNDPTRFYIERVKQQAAK